MNTHILGVMYVLSVELLLQTISNGDVNIGKIRTSKIKNIARNIYTDYPDKITTNFDLNKLFLLSFVETDKVLLNKIAGYLVVLKKNDGQRHCYKRPLTRKEAKKLKRKWKYSRMK